MIMGINIETKEGKRGGGRGEEISLYNNLYII